MFVELVHISPVEQPRIGFRKVVADIGQVVGNAVAASCGVHAIQVADAVACDQCRDRPPRDVEGPALGLLRRRREPAVADNVGGPPAARNGRAANGDRWRIEKGLRDCAAIDMKLLSAPAARLNVEHHRREGPGDRG